MTATYIWSEVRRVLSNKRFMIFSLAVPVLLLLTLGSSDNDTDYNGLGAGTFYMVSLATFGALSAVFSSGSRVSLDRSTGWNRQLRLTALKGHSYAVGKLFTGLVTAVPGVIVIFVLSAALHDVRLSAFTWVATAVAIIVALLPIGLLGVATGYLARPDTMGPITGALFTVMSLMGGVWYPLSEMPHWMQLVSKALPMTWSTEAGHDLVAGNFIPLTGVLVLVAWALGAAALAGWAYRRDAYRA